MPLAQRERYLGVRHTFSDTHTHTFENELIAHKILDEPVGELITRANVDVTQSRRTYVANRLSKRGIRSARDLLVVGKEAVTTVDKLDDPSHAIVSAAMDGLAQEHPLFSWHETSPDAMIARWCSSPDQVSGRVVHPSLWRFNVEDLVEHPYILNSMYNRDRRLADGLEKRRNQFMKTFVTVRRMMAVHAIKLL